mgnify:CR=1 FL=1
MKDRPERSLRECVESLVSSVSLMSILATLFLVWLAGLPAQQLIEDKAELSRAYTNDAPNIIKQALENEKLHHDQVEALRLLWAPLVHLSAESLDTKLMSYASHVRYQIENGNLRLATTALTTGG